MDGEKINRSEEGNSQTSSEWDTLADIQYEDIEEVDENQAVDEKEESETDEDNTAGMVRRSTKLPQKIEEMRKDIFRKFAPNTMPKTEQLVNDTSREGLSYIDELCENWPIFKGTKKVKIGTTEVDFPAFNPEVQYIQKGREDYTGYLSTPDNPEYSINRIVSEIGKKNASIITEACLDNPLVATLDFEKYNKADNSDYICSRERQDGLRRARVRLIDESLPMDTEMGYLNSRLGGVEYSQRVEKSEIAEGVDTVQRAMVAYHEIGHGIDYLTNHLEIQKQSTIGNGEILDSMTAYEAKRARDIECARSIPSIIFKRGLLSEDEQRVILDRRGFDSSYSYTVQHYDDYNRRCYREMPCEQVADDYARKAVCVKHRNHYYAKNENERKQNPEKRNLPVYGEIIYMGEANSDRTDFLDQELINSGIIAGKFVAIQEEIVPQGVKVEPGAKKVQLPDDYDYDADQRTQRSQRILAKGYVAQNPSGGRFEVVDQQGQLIASFAGRYYRQQNQHGETELINGEIGGSGEIYRVLMEQESEQTVVQYGAKVFNEFLSIDEDSETSILLVNDNSLTRVLLPKGGFASNEAMYDASGNEMQIPMELFVYNGIPKLKFSGQLYEVVPGSDEDLRKLKAKIEKAKFNKLLKATRPINNDLQEEQEQ